jgi:UDP-N-acetylglucosamine acyltransferase
VSAAQAEPDMVSIHPSAIVEDGAQLDDGVAIGAFTIVRAGVRVGAGTTIGPHCVIEGRTTSGRDNRIFQFCSIGAVPQDKKYAGEPTELQIGDRNTIREFCTFNLGTAQDAGATRIGSDNWIMAYVHVAHDCRIGNHTTIANATQFGGHVEVDDWVTIGGMTGVHQFVRIGAHAMAGFQTRLSQDLPPFVTAAGNPAEAQGINAEGLRRRGYSPERIAIVKRMHRLLYRQGLTLDAARSAIEALAAEQSDAAADVALMTTFLSDAPRGIVR